MKISNFTESELDLLRKECNFTNIESQCFELKAKNCTDVQLSMKLSISESTVAVTMRRVRSKITTVLERNVIRPDYPALNGLGCETCPGRVYHTMNEWARIPDFLSKKGVEYIYADYRTENGVNIPRIKYGDGVSSVSNLPFATMSITDDDMEYWDSKPDSDSNDIDKVVDIDESYTDDNKYVFPSDGYVVLVFNSEECEHAEVKIYGAGEKSYFVLSKFTDRDHQSKEVFVKRGMKCSYLSTSENAKIQFMSLT